MNELLNSQDYYSVSEELRNKYRITIKVKATDHYLIDRGCKIGDEIISEPNYSTTAEAYNLLVNYYSKLYFYLEQSLFLEKAKSYSPGLIKGELNRINTFIEEATMINAMDAIESYGRYEGNDLKMVYVRFKEGFYENLEINNYPTLSTIGLAEARVYGRYFLFREFLEQKLKQYTVTLDVTPKVVDPINENYQVKHVDESQIQSLRDICYNENSYDFLLELMEKCEITENGICILNKKKAGALCALIERLRESMILKDKKEKPSRKFLLDIFNRHLKTHYKEFNNRSEEFKNSLHDIDRMLNGFKRR